MADVTDKPAPRAWRSQPRGAVEQRLAAQAAADVAGFLDRECGDVGVTGPGQVLGVVEQAMRQMIGGAQLAQAGDRASKARGGGVAAVPSSEAGADQVAFGPQHGRKLPRLVGVEQGKQLLHDRGVL